jgi:hypothetical protein
MSQWFRMYSDVVHNPKVQRLAPELFKFWVNILCISSENSGELGDVNDIAFVTRQTKSKTIKMLSQLHEEGLLDKKLDGNICYIIHNWDKRQYKSDKCNDRVKRYRERKCNVTVTPPEQSRTDTDTDTEAEQSAGAKETAVPPGFRKFIEVFDDALGEVFGREQRRPWPASTDAMHATAFERLGVSPEWCKQIFIGRFASIKSAGGKPPKGLSYFQDAVSESLDMPKKQHAPPKKSRVPTGREIEELQRQGLA